MDNNWKSFFSNFKIYDMLEDIFDKLDYEYANHKVYPPRDMIFNAFELTPYDKIKVVILGQDCYHGEGQAMGLSFSVPKNIKIPPSLRNIFKEIENEYGIKRENGDLSDWAEQGVFLLNTHLTVLEGKPLSHKKIGWEMFTDEVIKYIELNDSPIVYLLWGNEAQKKEKLITNPNHIVLKSVHPSPLSASRGFFGNNHFIGCNNYLRNNGIEEINWVG